MKSIVLAAAVVLAAASAPAFASPASSLGDCYNHVISACNQKTNVDAAHACANSGMDACDQEHANASTVPPGTILKLRKTVLADLGRTAPRRVVEPVARAR